MIALAASLAISQPLAGMAAERPEVFGGIGRSAALGAALGVTTLCHGWSWNGRVGGSAVQSRLKVGAPKLSSA